MTIYNYNEEVSKFMHRLVGKIDEWNVSGILISIKEGADEELTSKLSEYCEYTLKTSEMYSENL